MQEEEGSRHEGCGGPLGDVLGDEARLLVEGSPLDAVCSVLLTPLSSETLLYKGHERADERSREA